MITCDECGGDGYTTCPYCQNGVSWEDCPECGGEGCPECSDGRAYCEECDMGDLECPYCDGTGEIENDDEDEEENGEESEDDDAPTRLELELELEKAEEYFLNNFPPDSYHGFNDKIFEAAHLAFAMLTDEQVETLAEVLKSND